MNSSDSQDHEAKQLTFLQSILMWRDVENYSSENCSFQIVLIHLRSFAKFPLLLLEGKKTEK